MCLFAFCFVLDNIQMKSARSSKPFLFKRDRPDLPSRLDPLPNADEIFADGEVIIDEQQISDLERPGLKLRSFQLNGSVLERASFAGGQFSSAVWKDVRFAACDLANLQIHRLTLVRAEMTDCRMTGFRATALELQDVLLQEGELRYAQLQDGKFRACEFVGCNLQDADFQGADLTGCVFRSCNLARADLRGAKLQNTDFRRSDVDTMMVNINDLRGAIVEPVQAMIFARLLGLQIL